VSGRGTSGRPASRSQSDHRAGRHALYDRIGRSYVATRGEDPRIAAAIHGALGDARTVLNVGAGAGSYEPRDRDVTAVEPSAVMRAQRPPGAAPCIDARAEALPFADGEFDATMAVLSDHHWDDRLAGLRELRRVGRRAVVFQWDPEYADAFWLARDYLPSFPDPQQVSLAQTEDALGATRKVPVPIPHDCRDGFLMAYWRRPEAYLDPVVRANISVFSLVSATEVEAMVAALRTDLASGEWTRRNAELLELDELDFGYRVLVAE
jgi:SAM-dependent methyltransferase